MVFKTHFDLGYTDMASNVLHRYRTSMIDDALKVVDRNRDLPPEQQFAWTLAGWPLAQIAGDWPGQSPERRDRVMAAFRTGRFVVHALPFTLHTESLEPEDVVRGLEFSSRLSKHAGLNLPRDAKMTDVPCHTWLLPTVLRRAGVEFLHLGCNAASRSPQVPSLFWWEGPDGSRLLTMYTAESYGTGLVPTREWPHPVWLALLHTGDNHGPPRPEEVKSLLAEARAKMPGVKVRIGRLSDFSDALLARKPDLPVVRGDMPDTWIHGPQCDPVGARTARNLRPLLETTEVLNTQLRLWGLPVDDASPELASVREGSLLYGEHTWGGALSWAVKYSGGNPMPYGAAWEMARASGRFARLESSWEEHSDYIRTAAERLRPVLARQLDALASAIAQDGPRRIVFNPLPWKRSGVARSPTAGETTVFVEDVPATGYRTLPNPAVSAATPETDPPASDHAQATTLENRWFRLTLDPRLGRATALQDRTRGRELVDPAAPHGLGQVLVERFSADDCAAFVKAYVKIDTDWATNELGKPNLPPSREAPYRAWSPGKGRLQSRAAADRIEGILSFPPEGEYPAVTTRWTLPARAPYLDLEVTVHDKKPDPWPEALWIALPFAVDRPEFRVGRPGSILDPSKDIVPGSNRHLFTVQTGVALFEASAGPGVGICPLDSGLVSLGQPGCWKYSIDDFPRAPSVYVNVYNNQWTTNFRLWNGGTWTSRVRIWAFGAYDPEASLITPSLEARYPMMLASASGPAGSRPTTAEGLSVDRRGVLVTAWSMDPYASAPAMRLRLWELSGRSGPAVLRWPVSSTPPPMRTVALRGNPLQVEPPVVTDSGQIQLTLPAFAPLTLSHP